MSQVASTAFEMGCASFLELGSGALNSLEDRGGIDRKSVLGHHFLHVWMAVRRAFVPANAQPNDLDFARDAIETDAGSSSRELHCSWNRAAFTSAPAFLQDSPCPNVLEFLSIVCIL